MFINPNFFLLSEEGLYAPMATGDVVVVTTGTNTSYYESSDGFDCRERLDGCHSGMGTRLLHNWTRNNVFFYGITAFLMSR